MAKRIEKRILRAKNHNCLQIALENMKVFLAENNMDYNL